MSKLNFLVIKIGIIITVAIIAITGCDTGNNNAPVINGNLVNSTTLDSLSYQAPEQENVASSNMTVVPTNEIQVVNKATPRNEEFVREKPVSHHQREHHTHYSNITNKYNASPSFEYTNNIQVTKPKTKEISNKKAKNTEHIMQKSGWIWPAKGNLITSFSSSEPGIEIQGQLGDPIIAVNAGTVIYSQNNVNNYGNFIIIDQGNHLLTAYAYNQTLLVHPGQKVVAGQKIATMGDNPKGSPSLYFQVRHNGKPVNPLTYLSKNS